MGLGFKEQNKISWNEGKYKKTLSDSDLKIFKSLNRNQKDIVVLQYIKDDPINLSSENYIDLIKEASFKHTKEKVDSKIKNENHKAKMAKIKEQEIKEANYDRLIKFFTTQGIYNPSQTTLDAFNKQNIMANFDKFYHALGTFTLNMEKQAMYNYYQTQQNQNFIQIAQNDTLIKQNDEIIELLKTIANK
ncbi:hypothetical protein [Staphylococcus saprophyticus]|uniref:Uncharacterized protein n=1 Tax=Staphylococcus virus IME1354_01 TaxID=3070820 RepID=A0A1W6JQ94_9CAUD|nr:hypothetical protein [Staphylococcus saprophyticus]YP_010648329.1 hypothetical protein PP279_gp05 [Staphylococcus virus IME1354_01]ARM68337.1 hypothetical protein [Staphylococcus virus IME1354_01]MCM3118946.1 hypothetical protein [Staphylococcus saprophyticus]MEB8335752.1 hypothetical protein [Staphylococcus saprophyticus]